MQLEYTQVGSRLMTASILTHFMTRFLTTTISVPYKQSAVISDRLNVYIGLMMAIV
jgi:hypothetical protein